MSTALRGLAIVALLSMGAACSGGGNSAKAGPDSAALLQAGSDDADWIVPGKTYGGNRVTGLSEISPSNVSQLKKAWITDVKDAGEEEASPIAWDGTVYVSTSHDNVLALDGKLGRVAVGVRLQSRLRAAVSGQSRRWLSKRQALHRHPGLPVDCDRCGDGQTVLRRAGLSRYEQHLVLDRRLRLQGQGDRRHVGRRPRR